MRLTPFTLALVLLAPATPAPAAEPQLFVAYGGASCGMDTSGRPQGGRQVGTIQGGPVFGVTADTGVTRVMVICSIQVGVPDFEAPDQVSVPGVAGPLASTLPPTSVTFTIEPGTYPGPPVYLCTEVQIGSQRYRYDTDSTRPGDQCAETAQVSSGEQQSYVSPSSLWGTYCVAVPPLAPICVFTTPEGTGAILPGTGVPLLDKLPI